MKYSQSIGIAASLALLAICFLPWSYIASQQITVSGFSAAGTDFGKPALFNFFMSVCMLILFAVPAVWSKRVNVFLGALNLAWAFRNYLLVSGCLMGECPEKKPALYLLVGLAILMQLMTLLPKLDIKNQK
ncbi:MAG: hypothetical protein AAB212_02335 [Bacteroidota bacterium]